MKSKGAKIVRRKKRVLDVSARPFGGFRRGMLEFSRQI